MCASSRTTAIPVCCAPCPPTPTNKKKSKGKNKEIPCSPPTKGGPLSSRKKPQKKKKTPKEKRIGPKGRTVPRRTSPNSQTIARIARAQQQRLFMVNAEIVDELHRRYKVLGSTGNVYEININTVPTCTCPDFRRRQYCCKHVLFVFLKVLRVNKGRDAIVSDDYGSQDYCGSAHVYQKALLPSELREIFAAAPTTPYQVLANDKVVAAYNQATGVADEPKKPSVSRKPIGADGNEECPICMEDFEADDENVTWCKGQCGNNIHKECIREWLGSGKSTCPYCRAEWSGDQPKKKKKRGKKRAGAYINLATEAGVSTRRDTSSYSEWFGYRRSGWGRRRRRW